MNAILSYNKATHNLPTYMHTIHTLINTGKRLNLYACCKETFAIQKYIAMNKRTIRNSSRQSPQNDNT